MPACTNDLGFSHYFKENMNQLGLDFPGGMYTSYMLTMGLAKQMSDVISLYGPTMPVTAVMFRATMGMAISPIVNRVATLGVAVGASYYVGAVIGSSAVSVGRTISCGTSIADALAMARENQIYAPWVEAELLRHPEFLKSAA